MWRPDAARALALVGLAVALLAAGSEARASGWVQPRGACYLKIWDRSWIGSGAYSAEGPRDQQEVFSYHDHLVSLYGECG